MSRLTTIKPRLGAMSPRLGGAPRAEDRSWHRDQTQPWRAWYKTARWQRLRKKILTRDSYTCQATGALLVGRYPAGNSPVIDHIKPHRGNPDRFWDEGNLQSVSKAYHDGQKQSQEKRGLVR